MNEIRLYPAAPAVEPSLLDRYRHVSTAALSDSMARRDGCVGLRPIDSLHKVDGCRMAGTALTVRTRPGDNLAVHKALDLARPGDVLVVDARGEVVNAIVGELMTSYAASRGIAGMVIDGAVRDVAEISAGGLPVYSRGVSHLGPYKSGPGEIHGAISVGGIPVHDGDVVVGDHDGVVVIPAARAESVVAAAERVVSDERAALRAIDTGTWDRTWIDAAARIVAVEESV